MSTNPSQLPSLMVLVADPITNDALKAIAREVKNRIGSIVIHLCDGMFDRRKTTLDVVQREIVLRRALKSSGMHESEVRIITSAASSFDIALREGCDTIMLPALDEQELERNKRQAQLMRNVFHGTPISVHHFILGDQRHGQHALSPSNGLIAQLVSQNADVSAYVPVVAKAALEKNLNGQCFIGVTGCIASGKSTIAAKLLGELKKLGHEARYVDIDRLVRFVYSDESPAGCSVRTELADTFGPEVLTQNTLRVDFAALKRLAFEAPNASANREFLERLTAPHVWRLYRDSVTQMKGIILVEWAIMAEKSKLDLVNGNLIHVVAANRFETAQKRGISAGVLGQVDSTQMSDGQKREAAEQFISTNGYGKVIEYDNDMSEQAAQQDDKLDRLAQAVLKLQREQ